MNQKHPLRFSWQVSWTLAARILAVGSSVAIGVLIARTLGAEGVGLFAVVSLTVNTLVQVLGAGMASANLFFVKRESDSTPVTIANALAFAAVAGTVGAAITFAIFRTRPDWFNDVPAELLLVALIMLPFHLWTLFGINIFLGLGEVKLANVLDSSGQLLYLVSAVIVLLLMRGGLYELVGFNVAAAMIVAGTIAFLVLRANKHHTVPARPDLGRFLTMMRFGVKINVMNAALAMILRADVLLVNYFHGQAEAGVYSVAAQCSLLLIMFPNVVGTMLFPNVAGMTTDPGPFSAKVIRHTAAIQLILSLIAIPTAFLLPLVYGPAFVPAILQFLILVPGAIMMGLQMMLSQHLVGIGKIGPLPIFWIVTLVVSVGLNVLLIPQYGAIGAAVVSTIAYAVIFVLTLTYFHKMTGQPIASVLFLRFAEARKLLDGSGW